MERHRWRTAAAELPAAGQRPAVPDRPVGRGSGRPPGAGDRRGDREHGPECLQRDGRRAPRLAQAHRRLDHHQPHARLVRHPGHRSVGAQDRDRRDPIGVRRRLPNRRPGLLTVGVAALLSRQRQLGRLRPRCDPAGRAVRRRAQRDEAHVQGARRRPAVRHRQAVPGGRLGRADHPGELPRRAAASQRPGSEGGRRLADLHDPGRREALSRDPRGGRPGERGATAGGRPRA